MPLELRDIRLVQAVAEQGSLTRAGNVLFLTQSALSRQLADLERRLGVALFQRSGRRMVPTPAADRRTIWARHTCFWGLLRFAATAFRWRRMAGVTVRDISVRIQQIHMPRPNRNPPTGFKC